jgi:F0F1-type ATP synthase beta subunit
MSYDNSTPAAPDELAYDLRSIYANLVGEHLLDIAAARKADNLYVWYKSLEDLHTIIKHKFKSDKDEKEFNAARDKVTTLANKFKTAFLGTNKNSQEIAQIEEALRQLEELCYDKMSKAKMFGEGGRIAGL